MEQNLPKENDPNFQKYREFVYRMECTKDKETRIRLDHAIDGLGSEAGELLGLMRKIKFYGGQVSHIQYLDELADNLHFLVMAMNVLGITLEDLCRLNMTKLKARHPNGFTSETALNKNKEKEQEEINKIVGEADAAQAEQRE